MTRRFALTALALGASLAAGVWLLAAPRAGLADAGEIARGSEVYEGFCAACHGENLQGQPDWQRPGETGRYPAPPHDATGHTWHHSDKVLAQIIYWGTAAMVGNGYESDMPAFKDTISEDDILAVLSYIKSAWPEREAAYQRQITLQN
ncbi:MAG: cytochrome c [Phaeovulum sp.]|uniref:c-type cytochrome n=1 Tax=Phaeovulum sp. TaxID=2934796 RepID=UPI00272F4BF9|nr:cytochrome c [Phaeovulum sp.]MDP2062439.1 cytochrome c [Phaeovulum sp.]MDP3861327.1 cytochrome c [Phaeovulum sp.]